MRRINLIPGLNDRVRLLVLPEPIFAVRGASSFPPFPSTQPPGAPASPKAIAQVAREMTEKYSGNKFEPVFTIIPYQASPTKVIKT
jgi:hypothetical protein